MVMMVMGGGGAVRPTGGSAHPQPLAALYDCITTRNSKFFRSYLWPLNILFNANKPTTTSFFATFNGFQPKFLLVLSNRFLDFDHLSHLYILSELGTRDHATTVATI